MFGLVTVVSVIASFSAALCISVEFQTSRNCTQSFRYTTSKPET